MRNVLIVGGPCDGMRIEQQRDLRTISFLVEGQGRVEYRVRQYSETCFIAAPPHIENALEYIVARYPQFVDSAG